jgi:hypothetical protein
MSDIIYYCEQNNPYCAYPHCVCNTVRPIAEEKSAGGLKIDAGLLIHKIINDQGKTLKSVEFDLIWYFIEKCSLRDFEKIKDLIYDSDE